MVGEIVPGRGMREDGEVVAIDAEPGRNLAKLCGPDGDLDATTWMRADGLSMKMADRESECFGKLTGEMTRMLDLIGIEINVHVETMDRWLRHCR